MGLQEGFDRDLDALIGFAEALNGASNLEETYRVALDSAMERYNNVDMVMVYLIDEERGEAVLEAHKNAPNGYLRRARRIPYPKGIVWRGIKTGGVVSIKDIQKEPDSAERSLGHRGALCVPITLEEKAIGVISFLARKGCSFSEGEIKALSILGERIGVAIAKAKQAEELRERDRLLSILGRVSQLAHGALSLDRIYETVLEIVEGLRFVDFFSVYLVEGEGDKREAVLQVHKGYTDEYLRRVRRVPYGQGITWRVITSGEPVLYENASYPSMPLGVTGRALGIHAVLSVPVRFCYEVIGAIEFLSRKRGSFSRQEKDFLLSLGNQIGTILAEARMSEEMRSRKEALKRSEERYRALYEDNPSMCFTVDGEGRVLSVNRFGAEQLGYRPDDLVGHPVLDVFHEDDKEAVSEQFAKCLRNPGRVFRWEFRKVRKDGSVLWVRESARTVKDMSGNTVVLIVCEDITERKQMEEVLSESLGQLAKKSRYENIISTITRGVHQSIDLKEVLENAVDAMSENIDRADIVVIYLVEGQEAVLMAHRGLTERYIERAGRIPYPEGITWKTLIEGVPIYCGDVDEDGVIGPAGRELGIKSYLSVPIRFEGRAVGTMGINSFERNAFNEEELNLLEIVVSQIEVAINNARRVDALKRAHDELEVRVRERTAEIENANRVLQTEIMEREKAEKALQESLAQLSRKNRYETIVSTVTRSVHQSLNLKDVLDNAVEAISKNINRADGVAIYLVEGQEAVIKGWRGFNDQYIKRAGRIPYPRGLTWKTIIDGSPRYVGDVDKDTVIGQAGRDLGIKSYLSMPIRFKGKTMGVMIITSFEKNAFDEEELKLLEIVAQQIEVAINNAWQAEALQEAKEELELRVQERTLELSNANEDLRREIAWRTQAEKALRESEERYRTLVEHTYVLIAEASSDGRFLYASPKHKDVLGYESWELIGTRVFEYIHPDDCSMVMAEFARAMGTLSSGHAVFRFKHKNGEWRWLESTGKPYRTVTGEIRGVISSRDITEHKWVEEQVRESLKEKEVLLKEIHHRVKNNLQVISSLISIQSQYTKNKRALAMFHETQNRIKSMALIHEQLYQSKNMAMVRFSEYVHNLLSNLLYSYEINPDVIHVGVNVEDVFLTIDTAIPCGLIINELVSNSLKYAFPRGRRGKIRIQLRSNYDDGTLGFQGESRGNRSVRMSDRSSYTLIVSDNGVGLPKDLDFRNTDSLGLQLVMDLVEQLGGSIELDRDGGTTFKIGFKEL